MTELDLDAIEARAEAEARDLQGVLDLAAEESALRQRLITAEAEVARLKARLEKAETVCESVESYLDYVAGFPDCQDDAPKEYLSKPVEAWRAAKGEAP